MSIRMQSVVSLSFPLLLTNFLVFIKLIVAVTSEELPRLENLYERGLENGVKGLVMLSKDEIKDVEPHCQVNN